MQQHQQKWQQQKSRLTWLNTMVLSIYFNILSIFCIQTSVLWKDQYPIGWIMCVKRISSVSHSTHTQVGSVKVHLLIGLAERCGLHTQKGHQRKSSEMGFVTGLKTEKLHWARVSQGSGEQSVRYMVPSLWLLSDNHSPSWGIRSREQMHWAQAWKDRTTSIPI